MEQYKIACDLQDRESARFWERNNVFLLIQGGMLAFFATRDQAPWLEILLASEGIALCVLWLGVLVKGRDYVYRWSRVVVEMETSERGLPFQLFTLCDAMRGDKPRWLPRVLNRATTKLMLAVILSLSLAWGVILVHGVLRWRTQIDQEAARAKQTQSVGAGSGRRAAPSCPCHQPRISH
jgi:hypothetical protein